MSATVDRSRRHEGTVAWVKAKQLWRDQPLILFVEQNPLTIEVLIDRARSNNVVVHVVIVRFVE